MRWRFGVYLVCWVSVYFGLGGWDVGLGGFWFAVVVNASLGGFGGLLRLGFIYYGCDDSLWRSAVFGFGLLFGVGGDC